jgi:hypothetical protein
MFDLPYILTHPLLKSIMVRHAELKEQAESLPQGSAEWKGLEKRISHTWSSTGFQKRTKEARDKERMFLTKAVRRSVNVTAYVSGRSSDEGPTRRIHDQDLCSIRRKIGPSGKALAGDCGPIRT